MPFQALACSIHLDSQVFDARQYGVEAAEMSASVVGNNPGQSCFADPRRAMQDQVADPIGFDGTAQEPSVGKDPALTLKFLQRSRTHAIGQGGQPPPLLLTVKSEEVLAQRTIGVDPVSLTFSISA